MRNKGISLLILPLFLVMLAVILAALPPQEAEISQITFRDNSRGLSLKPYHDQANDQYYLFLPAFLSPEDLTVSQPWYVRTGFSAGGQDCPASQLPLNQVCTMTVTSPLGGKKDYSLQLLSSSSLQTICLETKAGTMEQIDADQTQERSVSVVMLDETGKTRYQGYGDISGRGNGTWAWDKKPYDLKLPQKISFGPFQDTNKFCLLAEYVDRSKMRNALAYYAGQALEIPYSSDYCYANVYIDGVYQGLYGIATKEEYTKHLQEDQISAVFELSSSGKGYQFYTDFGKAIRIHHGTLDTILDKVEKFEYALMDRDWDTMYQYIDLNSWARKYALDEFFANYDLPLTSQYFYLDSSGLIRCMLPWDYEWIFYARTSPFDFTQEKALAAYWSHGNWYEILLESEQFRQAVSQVLREEFTPEFLTELSDYLDQTALEIADSWHCDRIRWHSDYAREAAESSAKGNLTVFCQEFKAGMAARLEFMVPLFENWEDHCLILFFSQEGEKQYQTNLQLILPRGTDLRDYHQRILDTLTSLRSFDILSCSAEDGTPLSEITAVQENMTITTRYLVPEAAAPEAQPEAVPASRVLRLIRSYPVPLTILAVFGGFFLLLALKEVQKHRKFQKV